MSPLDRTSSKIQKNYIKITKRAQKVVELGNRTHLFRQTWHPKTTREQSESG